MSINHKFLNELENLNLSAKETGFSLINDKFQSVQGFNFVDYKIFDNINDVKSKNYSVNILTDQLTEKSFINPSDKNDFNNSITTKLAFNGTNSISSNNLLRYTFTDNELSSSQTLGFNVNDNTSVTIEFIDDENCKIKTNMNGEDKFLSFEKNEKIIYFAPVTTYYNSLSNETVFQYNYDKDNQLIVFSLSADNELLTLGPNSGTLSAIPDNQFINGILSNSTIAKIVNPEKNILFNSFNNFVYYDINDFNKATQPKVADISLSGLSSNYLAYILPENIKFDGENYNSDLRFFNTKNQLNDSYNVTDVSNFGDRTTKRNYTSLLNTDFKEKSFENLNLGYNFNHKDYTFIPDKVNKFTLPNSLAPFRRININDSNLSNNGGLAGESPYFSDKIFKLLDKNKNSIPQNQNEGNLLKENDFFVLLQNNNFLNLNDQRADFENNGVFLCSWLSGNDYEKGIWYDRYYNPKRISFTSALTGNTLQSFFYDTLAKRYFNENNIESIYYDVKSNMVFEPFSTYYYQRVGNEYVTKIIEDQKNRLLKDTFNLTFTGNQIQKSIFNLEEFAIDSFNIGPNDKSFSIKFDLELNSLSSLNTYNLIGNYYEDGISLSNNFYVTPFIYIQSGNKLVIFDSYFKNIQTVTYDDITAIHDILFLEQTNNLILVCNDRLIKTSFNGNIIDQVLTPLALRILDYKDRIVSDNQIATILKNSVQVGSENVDFVKLDLKTLSISADIDTNRDPVKNLSGDSIVFTSSGIKSFQGFNGKFLDENIGVSLNNRGSYLSGASNTVNFVNLTNNSLVNNGLSGGDNNLIYDINTFNKELYIQIFNRDPALPERFNTSIQGKIFRYDTLRNVISTYNLSTSATSGYKLDFINENDEIKLLSFSRDSNNNLLVDKFSLINTISSSHSLSSSSIGKLQAPALTGGDSLGNFYFPNPVGFSNIEAKYKDKQGNLLFRLNLNEEDKTKLRKDTWNVTSDLTGFNAWSGLIGSDKQNWQTFFTDQKIFEQTEYFVKYDINKLENTFTFNFNLENGIIDLYLNNRNVEKISFKPNRLLIDNFLSPPFFFNNPVIINSNVDSILQSNSYFSKGGKIKNLKIYKDFASNDFLKFLYLQNKPFDPLILDIPCGSRSNFEEINNLYGFNLPGAKNNTLKIYIKNSEINEKSKEKIINLLTNKLKDNLPSNIDKIIFDLDINFNN